ncbi:MAG: hypothetical protein J5604_01510 [Bacteroidales bacterium]|nr:hypothetical protein [Bacteroidales bacterium]
MKIRLLFTSILILTLACQREDPNYKDLSDKATEADSVFTLTLTATKGNGTKALNLVNGGNTINAYWIGTDKVKVYRGGTYLGTLDVSPADGEKPTTATLNGTITVSGLAKNNTLLLRIPRENWDYTGQNGALTGANSIEEKYSYASAVVTVNSIMGSSATTTNANFVNDQSIYRFGFKFNDSYINPKDFTISASQGKLVQSISCVEGLWVPLYGAISVTPAAVPADNLYYISLRNESTADDTYSFVITGADNALYVASKTIPASVLDAPGKFIGSNNVTVTQPLFSPKGTEITFQTDVY